MFNAWFHIFRPTVYKLKCVVSSICASWITVGFATETFLGVHVSRKLCFALDQLYVGLIIAELIAPFACMYDAESAWRLSAHFCCNLIYNLYI